MSNKLLQLMEAGNRYFKDKIDPRIYEETLECLGQILPIEVRGSVEKSCEKQVKNMIRELLQMKDK